MGMLSLPSAQLVKNSHIYSNKCTELVYFTERGDFFDSLVKDAQETTFDSLHAGYFFICKLLFQNIFQEHVFVWFDSLRPSQQSFSYVRTGLPGLNQY